MEKMVRRAKRIYKEEYEKFAMKDEQTDPVWDYIIEKQNYSELPGTDEEIKLLNDINEIYYLVKLVSDYCCQKYKESYVVARSAIYKLLYNHYKLEYNPSKTLSFEFMPSKINFKNQYVNLFGKVIRDTADNAVGYNSAKIEKPSKSITNHISTFLEKTKDDKLFLLAKRYKNTFKYCVRYIDSVNLFLYFIYQDGRIFDSKEILRLPEFDPTSSCSKKSLQVVYEIITSFFSRIPTNNDDWLFYICELFQVDSFFKIFKINRMADRYVEFMSDENLEKIFKAYNFSYSEAKEFDSIIIDKAFKNIDFIKRCLQCEYIDPFYIFKLYLFQGMEVYHKGKNTRNFYNSLLIDGKETKCDVNEKLDFSEIIDYSIKKTTSCISYIEEDAKSFSDSIFSEFKEKDEIFFYVQDIVKSDSFVLYYNYKDFRNNVFINKIMKNNESNLDFINYFDFLCDVARKLLPGPVFSPKKEKRRKRRNK